MDIWPERPYILVTLEAISPTLLHLPVNISFFM